MQIVTNNWDKFKLLMWKNWRIQWNHKLQFLLEILIPPLFSCILVYIRFAVMPDEIKLNTTFLNRPIKGIEEVVTIQHYDTALPIRELAIVYSPKNQYIQQIMDGIGERMFNFNRKYFEKNLQIVAKSNELEVKNYMFHNKPIVGVVFDQHLKYIKKLPEILSYSLLFPAELRSSSVYRARTWETSTLFKDFERGPRCEFSPNYNEEGFLIVQNAIAMQYLKLLGLTNFPYVTVQCTPYPPYIYDVMLFPLQHFSSLIIVLSFIYPVTQTVKGITLEKEKKMKEVMKIMGLANWLHWTAWFIKTYIMLVISVSIIVLFMKIRWIKTSEISVLQHSDWSVIWVFFLIYIITTITFCFMLATFFSKANTASAASGLIWFALFLPFLFTIAKYNSFTLCEKLLICLVLNIALSYGLKIIMLYETSGVGVHWFNLFRKASVEDDLTIGHIMIMMLVTAAIQMLITLYLEKISPGDFGVPEKWYFPLTKRFWSSCLPCCFKKKMINNESRSFVSLRHPRGSDFFELEPLNKIAGIQVTNLTKKFGKKKAVNNLSLHMYADEITVLLGHNGAGKTTTLSMLTGILPPTSGTILINGYDISTELANARASLGFCPQYDILFNDLTVREHIIFFSRLKGIKGHSVEREVQRYLKILDIKGKSNTLSKNLSGGMRRKLSVCTALCGNSKVVILDEPSSGMDPAARRSLWNLIQAEKTDRTFLITTHFMDEADVLGDKIAILSGGELKCYGTTFFLKKKFGVGYHLICVKGNNCDAKNVTDLLSKFIPNIKIVSEIGNELKYLLPDSYLPVFQNMLLNLEEKSKDLDLNGYGISITTLGEVFLLAGIEVNSAVQKDKTKSTSFTSFMSVDFPGNKNPTLHTGFHLMCYQWQAMILKKAIFLISNIILLGIQVLVPPLMLVCAVVFGRAAFSLEQLKKLPLDLNVYDDSVTIIEQTNNSNVSEIQGYKSYIKSFGITHQYKIIKSDFSNYFLSLASKELESVNQKYLAASTIYDDKINIWYNTHALHSLPLSLNIAHNALLRSLKGNDFKIKVTNNPLPFLPTTKLKKDPYQTVVFQIILFTSFYFSFATSFFIVSVIKERMTGSKLIQFVSGVRIYIYWAAHFLFDFMVFLVIIIISLVTLVCFQEEGFATSDEIFRTLLLFLVFALAAIPFTYLVSVFFKDSATGFLFLSIFNTFTGLAFFVLVSALSNIPKTEETAKSLHYYFVIFPHYSLTSGLFNIGIIAAKTTHCLELCKFQSFSTCKIDIICQHITECCTEDYFSWKKPGILTNLVFLIISSGLYSTILLILEYRLLDKLYYCIGSTRNIFHRNYFVDNDVIEEQKRIKYIIHNDIEKENLLVHNVTKYFKKFVAVNGISVGVQQGQCFGLLGVNGAGKTTLFKMMTGDSKISFGNVYVQGVSIKTNINKFYQKIGYCPQYDALLEDFTGREVLKIFCLIHGIPKNEINGVIVDMAYALGFKRHLNKKIKYYSGGTKRKICTSIALLGNPVVIFLDEPTTGMDPGSRRQLWHIICKVRDLGKSIVLTSHSMEECEALCTRIAIMVNGEFQCIGSTQHLKNKFSKGLILKIKLRTNQWNFFKDIELAQLKSQVNLVQSFIEEQFPDSYLKERFQYLLTFYIPVTASIKWSNIFGVMESNKIELNIEDYSITQTTLEEIFLEFALKQREDMRTRN